MESLMPDLSDEEIELFKRYAKFDMFVNTAVVAMARDDKQEYSQAMISLLEEILQDQVLCVSFISYLVAMYGQTWRLVVKIMGAEDPGKALEDLMINHSLDSLLAMEDPSHIFAYENPEEGSSATPEPSS